MPPFGRYYLAGTSEKYLFERTIIMEIVKFLFSKKATKIKRNIHNLFDTYILHNVKSTVKISSTFVAFLVLLKVILYNLN